MTYHDRRLLEGQKVESKKRIKLRGRVLGGAFSLTLFPKSPRIVTGSIEGDWEAVGNDIRKAMKSYDACD